MRKLICLISPDLIMHLLFAIFFLFAGCTVHFKGTDVEAGGEIVESFRLKSTAFFVTEGKEPGIFEIDL